jgi:hypothetical protein
MRALTILLAAQLFLVGLANAHSGHAVVAEQTGLAHQLFEPAHGLGLLIAAVAVTFAVAVGRRTPKTIRREAR